MPMLGWWIALLALLAGTAIGWFVQYVLTSLSYNGDWSAVPAWKKRNLAATGSIAAFTAGLYVMQDASTVQAHELVIRLWLVQVIAAPTGATGFEVVDRLRRKLK